MKASHTTEPKPKKFPAQKQDRQPGIEKKMRPEPDAELAEYRGSGKLAGKVALITGGDSGIGRAVALIYAKEGADVAILYLDEDEDADETRSRVEQLGRKCLTIAGDIGDQAFCKRAVDQTLRHFHRINVLVNNAAEETPKEKFEDIDMRDMERTFRTNIFSFFYLTQAALKHMKPGDVIINTSSVTAYRGSPGLIDYSSTKGAIVSFTRSLAKNLVRRGIRVNAVAPGPIWTPLIPATSDEREIQEFGTDVPLGRAGQPDEVAPCYVFLASRDSSYMTGQVLHPNGGEVVNG